jgi:hypothetical protein
MQKPRREPDRRLPGDGASQPGPHPREDKDVFVRTRRAAALLADQPYPEGAVAWGATGVYRLYAGDIRILYEVDDETATVYIINIGVMA